MGVRSSIYILAVQQSMQMCYADCAAHPYYSKSGECTVNVASEAWLARTWASENVGVRQRAGDIEAHIVVREFPHYTR